MQKVRIARKNTKTGEIDSQCEFAECKDDKDIAWLQRQADEWNEEYKGYGYEWFLQYLENNEVVNESKQLTTNETKNQNRVGV